VCIEVLRTREPATRRLAEIQPDAIAISAMTVAELRYGALKGRTPQAARERLDRFFTIPEILAFDAAAAHHHAVVRLALARLGTPIGERDLVIAATALTHGLVVVTGNALEFRRVPGLGVEEWE
jgi:tRNA(fMet)-specific endonuclease VapC